MTGILGENIRYDRLVLASPTIDPNYGAGSPLFAVVDNLEAQLAQPDLSGAQTADLQRRVVAVGVAQAERVGVWPGERRAAGILADRVRPYVASYVGNTLIGRLTAGPCATGLADIRFAVNELSSSIPKSSRKGPLLWPEARANDRLRLHQAAVSYVQRWTGRAIEARQLGPVLEAAIFMSAAIRTDGQPLPTTRQLLGLRRERAHTFLDSTPERLTRGLPDPVRSQTIQARRVTGR